MAVPNLRGPLHEAELPVDESTLAFPIGAPRNPAHEMQRLLVERLGGELSASVAGLHGSEPDPLDVAVTFLSRLAGPVGFIGLLSALGWAIFL